MATKRKPTSKPDDVRRSLGRATEGAVFPIPSPVSSMPSGYASLLQDIKQRIQQGRLQTVLAANSAMVRLYWDIGRSILERQGQEGWGAKVIDRLAADLRKAFPDMRGLSPRNLKYMRAFAAAWPDQSIVQQLAAQIPWFHNCILLDRVTEPSQREWYIRRTIEHGWSRNILALQIQSRAHERFGKAISNFKATLPPVDSDLATQVFKDPYLFDFLGTADPRREREVEQALVDHIQRVLLELGTGFAFVGRQVLLEVGDRDFYVDLLESTEVLRPAVEQHQVVGPAHDRRELVHDAAGHAGELMLGPLAQQGLGLRLERRASHRFDERGGGDLQCGTARKSASDRHVRADERIESARPQVPRDAPGQHARHVVRPMAALGNSSRLGERDHRLVIRGHAADRRLFARCVAGGNHRVAVNRHRQHEAVVVVDVFADQIHAARRCDNPPRCRAPQLRKLTRRIGSEFRQQIGHGFNHREPASAGTCTRNACRATGNEAAGIGPMS